MKSTIRTALALALLAAFPLCAQDDDASFSESSEAVLEETGESSAEAVSESSKPMSYEEEVAAEDRRAQKDKEFVNAKDFGRKLGRAKKDNMIEAGFSGGLANKLWAYDIAYTRVVFDGVAAVTFPITVWQTKDLPESTTDQNMRDGKNLLIGVGAKVRYFHNQIDEGLFYGLGGKIFHIITEYERQKQGTNVWYSNKFSYQNFIPTSEVGYLYKFMPEFGVLASAELGVKFSTYDELNNEVGGEQAKGPEATTADKNPKGDPGRTPVFGDGSQWWYYTINVNLLYAF